MIYKTPHIQKHTNNDLQNTTHTQKHTQWSTKHHTYIKTQIMIYKTLHIHKKKTMIYKTLHIHKNTINDLQNTTYTKKHRYRGF